jgi:hypothetical protein
MSEPEVEEGPKPRIRWPISRQRLVELTVVVFGVMIALGLENLVQEIRLQGDARELEQAFRDDIVSAVEQSWERQVVAPCLVRNLASLTERVVTPGGAWAAAPAARTGNFALAMPQPYRVPIRLWTTSTFDRALGSEAFKRIPRERANAYAVLFYQIGIHGENNDAEYMAAANLAPLAFPQSDMNAEVRADLLRSLALVDRQQGLAVIVSKQLIELALSLPGGDDIRTEIRALRSDFMEGASN